MRFSLLALLVAWCGLSANAAHAPSSDYFQQAVDYNIEVRLDDATHTLHGFITIQYTNNAPDALNELYFHLWPNAYSSLKTAFARQKFNQGSTDFYYGELKDRGYIDSIAFEIEGQAVAHQLDAEHPDIAYLKLDQPIASGATVTIKTPFRVKVPRSVSRLGHVGTSYQITQWYPKPAVYDANGWHAMPYLDQGEFYSEFGRFDVTITLPANYVVGATGTLTTESERAFLAEQVAKTNAWFADSTRESSVAFPPSASELKTIHYTADRVHDFAWFADKRFLVQQSSVTLASGHEVTTWAMFTPQEASLWRDATMYLDRSVAYYSERIGEYPYPQATAVQSALSAGAGMEYPMITVIGQAGSAKSLDIVITHEVGHNWFYGILASNERAHTWMDEGFNSYYEEAYTTRYYGSDMTLGGQVPAPFSALLPSAALQQELGYLAFLYQHRRGEMLPPSSDPQKMTGINYGILGYYYPAYLFRAAEAYLGTAAFDEVMQAYYQKWQFKHPQPADVKAVFEAETGKDFGWLFDDLLQSSKTLDYALRKAHRHDDGVSLKVVNKGQIKAPYSVSAYKDGEMVSTQWYDGHWDVNELQIADEGVDKYRVDGIGALPDVRRVNNGRRMSGLAKGDAPLRLKFLGGLETGESRPLYLIPALAANRHDGFMLGMAFTNSFLPPKALEVRVLPMYAFGSQKVVGTGSAYYRMYPQAERFRHVKVGVEAQSFSKFDNNELNYTEGYAYVRPSIELKFQPSPSSTLAQYLRANALIVSEEDAQFTSPTDFTLASSQRTAYELGYELEQSRVVNPYRVRASVRSHSYTKLGAGQQDIRLSLEGQYRWSYPSRPSKGFHVRAYVGQFLANSDVDFGAYPLALSAQGRTDYFYEDLYLGRGDVASFGSQQYADRMGGFRTPLPTRFGSLGTSNNMLATLNLTLDAPLKFLPVGLFLDFGYYEDTAPTSSITTRSLYAAGLQMKLLRGFLTINLPVVGSTDLMSAYRQDRGALERLSFQLNLRQANPLELLRSAL